MGLSEEVNVYEVVKGNYGAMVDIGGRGSPYAADIEGCCDWHRRERCWLSSARFSLPVGTPVVARQTGELVMLGVVAGDWQKITAGDHLGWRIEIEWEPRTIRGVRAHDVLGRGGQRYVGLSRAGMRRVHDALSQASRSAAG